MLAPWPLATLAEASTAFMERDESRIVLGYAPATLAGEKASSSGEPAQADTSPEDK